MNKIIERIIFSVIIIVLWSMYSLKNKDYKEQSNLIEASFDTIKKWKGKNGQYYAKIQVLETRNSKDFLDLKSKDSTIIKLQGIVKENRRLLKKQGSVSVINSETKVKDSTKTTVIRDTVTKSDVYTSNITKKWYEIKTVARKDSTFHEFKTFSKLSLTIGLESQGLFKKPIPYGVANDENPFTDIKEMRIYQVSFPKRKSFSLAPSINVGVDFTGVIYTTFGVSLQLEKLAIKF
jgi:hypothetical protein